MTKANLGAALAPAATVVPLTRREARALTDRIRGTADKLWALLLEAHERRAWTALGYSSWRAYAKAEFNISQGHAYRLLDQGRVIHALEAAVNSPVGEISEREARDIKPRLVEVIATVKERISEGETPSEATQAAVALVREPDAKYLDSRKRRVETNRRIAIAVFDAVSVGDQFRDDDCGESEVDPACVPIWVKDLRGAAREINRFATRLERAVAKK